MRLVIAEKPSVARDIANILGANKTSTGYLSGNDYYVSWCVGHLVETAMPADYDQAYKKWDLQHLPIIPAKWKYNISQSTKKQFYTLKELMLKNEVKEIICATDAGREGELIFRLVYQQANCKKPFKRLWISSMEEQSIRKGFEQLKDGRDYDNLYHSALARLQADWTVGINISRLFSCLYNKSLNIGRVQTPTVNLIVERQRQIESFVAQPYFILKADCRSFTASKRMEDEAAAQDIIERCNGQTDTITSLTTKPVQENPSALYDLTTLQREANKMLGLSAQQTLDATQSLYEKKLVTYPRTDSRFLSSDMKDNTRNVIHTILKLDIIHEQTRDYDLKMANINHLINDKKVTDHHAIIPTNKVTSLPGDLTANEKNILLLIIYKLLAAAYISHQYVKTDIVLTIENEEFKATGKQITEPGFKKIEKQLIDLLKVTEDKPSTEETENDSLPKLIEGQVIENISIQSEKKMTNPPKPYTEDTLLSAMENVMKHLENEELKKEVAGIGLGTPATRAGIIEKIIQTGFIERKKKNLIPTQKAYDLIDVVPELIKSAELTAEWEKQLEEIYQGRLTADAFSQAINQFVTDMILEHKHTVLKEDVFKPEEKEVIGQCPRCGKSIYENAKSFYCEGYKDEPKCTFSLWKEDKFFVSRGKKITKTIAKALLKNGKVDMRKLKSKAGKEYDATFFMKDTGKFINFSMEFMNK